MLVFPSSFMTSVEFSFQGSGCNGTCETENPENRGHKDVKPSRSDVCASMGHDGRNCHRSQNIETGQLMQDQAVCL